MPDDPITMQETIDILRRGVEEISRRVTEIPDAVNDLLGRTEFPPEVRDFLIWATAETINLITSTLDNLHELLVGAAAPIWFFEYAGRWQEVRGTTTGVTGALNPDLMPAAYRWSGSAHDVYNRATGPQRDATERISDLAAKIDEALTSCAVAGVAFYCALAVAVTQLIISLVAALAALATGVGAPVGLGALLGSISVESFVIVGAVGTLSAILAVQAQQMTALQGEALDDSAFPGGRWPDPVTDAYADGTVTDGDADWSLRR